MKKRGLCDRKPLYRETGQGRRDLAHATREMSLHSSQGVAVVNRAEGLRQAVRPAGKHHAGLGPHGPGQELAQKGGGHFRHVAGDDQIPIGRSVMQGGEDGSQRTLAGVAIGNCRQLGVPHQGDLAGGTGHLGGHGVHQVAPAKRQAGLIPAHTGTAPPRQHVARVRHKGNDNIRLTTVPLFKGRPAPRADFGVNIRGNILRQFCFKLIIAGLAAGVALGAGADGSRKVTSVVRPDLRTGKLVRSMVVSPKPVAEVRVAEAVVPPRVVGAASPEPEPLAPPSGIEEAVLRIAAEHSLSPQLIHSVIKVESNYNSNAISSKGAQGLMQLIPATARRFGVSDAFNPVQNIQGGAKYLRYLLDLYKDNYPLALAAYNAGEGAVARYRGVPPFAETQNYVILVGQQLEQARKAAAAKPVAAPAPPQAVAAKETGPAHVVEIVQTDGSVRYVSR